MIYDADKDLVEIICFALEMEGFHPFGFNDSSADFLALTHRVKPRLVLLDFVRTGVFCIKWCQCIKYSYPDLPVIALSCNNKISEIFSEHGFDDYIPKPFGLEQLYTTVRKHI